MSCLHTELNVEGRCSDCGVEVASWLIDGAALLAEGDPGPTPYLIQDVIVDQALTAAVGRWKTSKSYGLLDMCISIATGLPAFGVFTIPEPGPVVFVNEESGRAALRRRLDALSRGRAIEPELLDRLFLAPNLGVKLDDEGWQARLIDFGIRVQPRLFAFDPLARMKAPARDESSQNEMATVIEFLRTLRDETGAGVLFVHHTGHQGEHMRGSSDLETAWESRLHWKRDGQSSEVTIETAHRDAEPAAPFKYRIAWDGLTRSMRLEAVEDPFTKFVTEYTLANPTASANAVYKATEGRKDRKHRTAVLELVKSIREGGSETGNHPGTTPSDQRQGGGSPDTPFRGSGTTLTDPLVEAVPKAGTTPEPTTPSQADLDVRPEGWANSEPDELEILVDEVWRG